eukprot:TRINITY_DN1944_c0_g1_i1.p1 TRINITY_DN1944_c0_g1~~TRINITY_DN1944_c0_g1_i1.p1  ORF type:complete len:404 (-),score=73.19 TRINITY_DN1944_c0_g1_i1:139-1350(-)
MSHWSIFSFFRGNHSVFMADPSSVSGSSVAGGAAEDSESKSAVALTAGTATTNTNKKGGLRQDAGTITTSPRGTHTQLVRTQYSRRPPSLAILTLRSGSTSEQLIRSRLPELVASASVVLTISMTLLSILLSLQMDYPDYSTWWVVFIPIWIGFPLAAVILGYSVLAPIPYLEQLRKLRSLQTGNNPSAVELIPLMIGAVGAVFTILLCMTASGLFCMYMSGSLDEVVYIFIPLFILHFAGILYAILIVDYSLEFLLLHTALLATEILCIFQEADTSLSSSLSFALLLLPLFVISAVNFILHFSNFLSSLQHILEVTEGEVDIAIRWKWAFLSMQYFWLMVFLVIMFIKVKTSWLPSVGFGYVTCFVGLELSLMCRVGHDLVVIYKHLQPARLNPTFLDVVIV